MYHGDGKALVARIYPIKHLNEYFLPYEFLLNITIFLISTLSKLIGCLLL